MNNLIARIVSVLSLGLSAPLDRDLRVVATGPAVTRSLASSILSTGSAGGTKKRRARRCALCGPRGGHDRIEKHGGAA